MSDYVVRPLVPADEPAVLELLHASLAGGPTGERTSEFFHWKHRNSPFGPSPGLVADFGGRIVGVRLLMRWTFQLGDRQVRAVRMVDTATAPDWQGRGIFKALTLQALKDPEIDLVFNTPNSQSLPGYLKMGWDVVGQVPISVRVQRPLRLLAVAARRQAGQAAVHGTQQALESPLPAAADLLHDPAALALAAEAEAAADPSFLRTARTPAFLQWRYGQAPGLDYRAVPAYRKGRLVGVGFGRLRHRGPLRELTLGDVIVAPGDVAAARSVLRAAARRGTDEVATHLTPDSAAAAGGLRAGYLTLPRGGMTLTSRKAGTLPVDPSAMGSWRLALGDLEVF